MACLYRKKRSPFSHVQYLDSEQEKHNKSTGLRADDPIDTAKARILRAELETQGLHGAPAINASAWDSWVPKFFDRH